MKFLIAITLICALAFTTVNSESCTSEDNMVSFNLCNSLKSVCDLGVETCNRLPFGTGFCKDNIVNVYESGVAAGITDCECAEICTSGATFAAMSLMAIFAAVFV